MQIPVQITWKTIGGIITLLGIIISTTAFVVWEIRKDVIDDLKRQISTYDQSQSWKLPDTLEKLNKISGKLNLQFSERDLLEKLSTENQGLKEENKKLQIDLADTKNKSTELSARIELLDSELRKTIAESNQIKLTEGDSAELVKNNIIFGLSHIYSDSITGNLNNNRVSLNIGGNVSVNVNGQKCLLVLKRVERPSAIFAFLCS